MIRQRRKSLFLLGSALLTLSACIATVPETQNPKSLQEEKPINLSIPDRAHALKDWWTLFSDPALNDLAAKVTEAPPDAQETLSRLQGGRALVKGSPLGAEQFDAAFEKEILKQSVDQPELPPGTDLTSTLIADIAHSYISYRMLEDMVVKAQETVNADNRYIDFLIRNNAQANAKEINETRTRIEKKRAEITDKTQLGNLQRRRIGILTSAPPEDVFKIVSKRTVDLKADPTNVLASPAQVLMQRPDIKDARIKFAEETKYDESVTGHLFPEVTLSTFWGVQDEVFANPDSIWNISPGKALELMEFNNVEARVDKDHAVYEPIYQSFRFAVLQAVMDVERAFTNYAKTHEENISLQQAQRSTREEFELTKKEFADEKQELPAVLTAQRHLDEIETNLVEKKYEELLALVGIYKSLGTQ